MQTLKKIIIGWRLFLAVGQGEGKQIFFFIPPTCKVWIIVMGVSVPPSILPSFRYTEELISFIRYSSNTTEWNWIKLSLYLYYMFQFCIFNFLFWSKSIWGFHIAKHGLYQLCIWGHGGLISYRYSFYTTEWNWMKLPQYLYYMCPLCTFLF